MKKITSSFILLSYFLTITESYAGRRNDFYRKEERQYRKIYTRQGKNHQKEWENDRNSSYSIPVSPKTIATTLTLLTFSNLWTDIEAPYINTQTKLGTEFFKNKNTTFYDITITDEKYNPLASRSRLLILN